jgi:DNA-binding protein YbaB
MISESLVKQNDSEILKDLINMNLNDLFNQLEENTTKELNKFKSIFKFKQFIIFLNFN